MARLVLRVEGVTKEEFDAIVGALPDRMVREERVTFELYGDHIGNQVEAAPFLELGEIEGRP